MKLELKKVPGFSNYSADQFGQIWNFRNKTPFVIKSNRRPNQYWRVSLISDYGEAKSISVHRVICLAWNKNPKPKEFNVVCHRDGNYDNNLPENLEWGTHGINASHKLLHGTHQAGEKHGMAKLTWEKVREIRKKKMAGVTSREIARIFKVTHGAIDRIVSHKGWRFDPLGEQ